MLIEEKVLGLLASASTVTDLLPANRILPPGDWQNLERPYVVHFPISPTPEMTYDGLAPLTNWGTYQISCFGDSYGSARAVSAAIVDALSGLHSGVYFTWTGQRMLQESDVRIIQVVVEFDVWEALSVD